jgi:hypothetical protein
MPRHQRCEATLCRSQEGGHEAYVVRCCAGTAGGEQPLQNNCHYSGCARDNRELRRYRLTTDTIVDVVQEGIHRGFRTFVLQGGETRSKTTTGWWRR